MPKKKQGYGYRLNWQGKQVTAKVLKATAMGIDRTMALCIPRAKRETPVVTGALQGSIRIVEFAKRRGLVVSGLWGSTEPISYAIYVEVGARGRPGVNMLRGAADTEYGGLPENINRYLKAMLF